MVKILRAIAILILFSILILIGGLGYWFKKGFDYQLPQTTTVLIPHGSSVREIASNLERQKAISNHYIFLIYLKLTGDALKLKAGEYEFDRGLKLVDVVDKMILGKTKKYKITIPEGLTIKDICSEFEKSKIMTFAECWQLALNPELLPPGVVANNLEGFLYPDTYFYDKLMTPKDLIKQMTDLFVKKIGAERLVRAKDLGFSPLQLVTLASVVEKETGLASERPIIARVFFNRLKIGMPLQSDPTVIYGIKNYNGNITRVDLQTDSPYNTYTRQGLPAGPICNPGLDAVDAILNPADSEALYFVAKGDGGHYFSKTLDEHNRAVQFYQLHRGSPP